jgi:hypothetical protein
MMTIVALSLALNLTRGRRRGTDAVPGGIASSPS